LVQTVGNKYGMVRKLQLENSPAHLIEQRRNKYWIKHRVYEHKQRLELEEGCEYLGDSMDDHKPSCNSFHEIDMNDFFMNANRTSVLVEGSKRRKKLFHIARGGFRHAFMVTEFDGSRRVLKMLRYAENRNFDHRNFDKMRRDAVASEQLSSSPRVADIYGYCSYSALADYTNEDNMLHIFDQDEQPTKDELFQISYDVAASVADMHHPNKDGRATIVHMDIKPNQWLSFNGTYVLNDFNLARFLSWNPELHENCGRATGYTGGRYEAPEQYTRDAPLTEKADVYSLGTVLYFLLTRNSPFQGKDRPEVTKILKNGGVLKLEDKRVLKSTHPFDVTVREVVKLLLNIDPQNRPSAREAADMIGKGLSEYKRRARRLSPT